MEQNLARRLLETEIASEANRTGYSSYVGEMSFDANMVVILAALSCALIGALGMNSILRCVLRCSQSPEGAAARVAATGLKKRDLGQIPVGVYGIGGGAGANVINIKGTDCAICLGEFQHGDKLRMLPVCNHGFHVRCIDTWLLSHSSCPNCRHSLLHPPLKVKENAAVSQPPPASASSQTHVVLLLQSGNQTQLS